MLLLLPSTNPEAEFQRQAKAVDVTQLYCMLWSGSQITQFRCTTVPPCNICPSVLHHAHVGLTCNASPLLHIVLFRRVFRVPHFQRPFVSFTWADVLSILVRDGDYRCQKKQKSMIEDTTVRRSLLHTL
jgi:hypothetical protein